MAKFRNHGNQTPSKRSFGVSNEALYTLLPIASWSRESAQDVEFTGGTDPILPTPFRISETSSAALAAVGLAASDLWHLRTGRHQKVSVDARQATASLRSLNYLNSLGKKSIQMHVIL